MSNYSDPVGSYINNTPPRPPIVSVEKGKGVTPPIDYMLKPDPNVVRALFASGMVVNVEQSDAGTSRWVLTLRSGQKCMVPWDPRQFSIMVFK